MTENLDPKVPAANTQFLKLLQIPSEGAKHEVAYKYRPSTQGKTPHPKLYCTQQDSLYIRERMRPQKPKNK